MQFDKRVLHDVSRPVGIVDETGGVAEERRLISCDRVWHKIISVFMGGFPVHEGSLVEVTCADTTCGAAVS